MAWQFFTNQGQVKQVTQNTVIAPTHLGGPRTIGVSAFPVANSAYLVPLAGVVIPFTFTRFVFWVGTASGNMDLGVYYSDDESTFTRLVSVGTFVVPGAGQNTKTVASTTITPIAGRRWYAGVACDNITATFGSSSVTLGSLSKVTSFVLPASLTAMSVTGTVAIPSLLLAV